MKEEYLLKFFGRQTDYYKDEYNFINLGGIMSFNIGAFFGGFLWLLYRKLYWQTATFLIMYYCIEVVELYLLEKYSFPADAQRAFIIITNFLIILILGFFGNFALIKHADRKIKKILEKYSDEEQRLNQMSKQGGVSIIALLAAIIITGCLIWLSVIATTQV
jgi:hypothetical protein